MMRKFIIITLAFVYNIGFILLLKQIPDYFGWVTVQQSLLLLYVAFVLMLLSLPLTMLIEKIADYLVSKIKKEELK